MRKINQNTHQQHLQPTTAVTQLPYRRTDKVRQKVDSITHRNKKPKMLSALTQAKTQHVHKKELL